MIEKVNRGESSEKGALDLIAENINLFMNKRK
jgi:hypothetical protein